MLIGGREDRTAQTVEIRSPHQRDLVLGRVSLGHDKHATPAIDAALAARAGWAALARTSARAMFLRAAELAASDVALAIQREPRCSVRARPRTRPRSTRPASSSTSSASTSTGPAGSREQPLERAEHLERARGAAAGGLRRARSPRSTSPRSPATCRAAPALLGNVVVWKPSALAMRSAHELMSAVPRGRLPGWGDQPGSRARPRSW